MRFPALLFAVILGTGGAHAYAAAPEPTTDEQKTLYALGLAMSQGLAPFGLSGGRMPGTPSRTR